MPIKLIFVILLAVIVAVFTGFNLDNKTNFWLFYNFKDISVLFLVFSSFLLGVLVTLPFTFGKRKRKNADKKLESENLSVTKEKKSVFKRKNSEGKSKKDESNLETEKSGVPTSTDENYAEIK